MIFWYIISFFLTVSIVYYVYENGSFWSGFLICYVGLILNAVLAGTISLPAFAIGLIPAFIENLIYSFLYNKSESYLGFLLKNILAALAIFIVMFGLGFILSISADISLKKMISQMADDREKAKQVIERGDYTVGKTIKLDEDDIYKLKINKIEKCNSITLRTSKGSTTYHPEKDKYFVYIQYNLVDVSGFLTNEPQIVLEDISKDEYSPLTKVTDSKTGKSADASLFFNDKTSTKLYSIYEVPVYLWDYGQWYLRISDSYTSKKEYIINRYSLSL